MVTTIHISVACGDILPKVDLYLLVIAIAITGKVIAGMLNRAIG
jgi:hypothetical protein